MIVEGKRINLGELRLEPLRREFLVKGKMVFLRNREFSLMEYLMKNTGIVLTRTRLLEDVWDRNICCSTNTVDVHMSNLRRKLNVFGCGDFIKTVHCIGYIFLPNY